MSSSQTGSVYAQFLLSSSETAFKGTLRRVRYFTCVIVVMVLPPSTFLFSFGGAIDQMLHFQLSSYENRNIVPSASARNWMGLKMLERKDLYFIVIYMTIYVRIYIYTCVQFTLSSDILKIVKSPLLLAWRTRLFLLFVTSLLWKALLVFPTTVAFKVYRPASMGESTSL